MSAPRNEPMNTPGSMPASKPNGGAGLASTRISHSAEGPLNVRPWICTGSKLACDTA